MWFAPRQNILFAAQEATYYMMVSEAEENYVNGYIKIYRSIVNHWLWIEKPYSKFEAWIFLLLRANHSDGKFNLGFELFEIKRGEFISSQEKLADQFGWSRNQVRSYLNLLQNDNMIKYETSARFTKITICNYDTYQSQLPAKQQRPYNDLTTTLQRLDNDLTQTSNYNNDNNVKNDNNINTESELLNSEIWHESVIKTCNLKNTSEVKEWVQKFLDEIKAKENFVGRGLRELKSHAVSWIKIEQSKKKNLYNDTSWIDELKAKSKQNV